MITKNYIFHYWNWGGFISLLMVMVGQDAQAVPRLQGSRSLAMGSALMASPTGESAVLNNPAGMSLFRAYQFNGFYQYRTTDSANVANLSIVDSITAQVAAGIYYTYEQASPQQTIILSNGQIFPLKETVKTHEAGLALSYPLASSFFLGFTTKYLNHTTEQPDGTSAELKAEDITGITLDVGGLLQLTQSLSVAMTGYNLVQHDPVFHPRLMGVGLSYALANSFLMEFDTLFNFTSTDEVKPSYHGGAEFIVSKNYALRGGAAHDTLLDGTYLTAGLGMFSSKIGLDVSFRQMVSGGSESIIAIGVRLVDIGGSMTSENDL